MRVFADPTELGSNSKLPQAVATVCEALPGLEARTGADLLITTLPIPASSDMLLERHLQSGMLVQLKRLNDLQSSITDSRLFHDILRMRESCALPWLVCTGVLTEFEGTAVMGNIETQRSMANKMVAINATGRQSLTYSAVSSALLAWRYYGGYVDILSHDDLLLDWLERQSKALTDIMAGKITELSPRAYFRELRAPGRVAWLATLFDGIGQKTAAAIYERLDNVKGEPATLFEAIQYVTTYVAVEVPGITNERVDEWRKHLGLKRKAAVGGSPATYAALDLAWRLEETGEVYWRGPEQWRFHYRNDGPFKIERLFTPYHLRELLGDVYTITYSVEGRTAKATGLLHAITMDRENDLLVILNEQDSIKYEKHIQIDKILDMKRETD